MIETLRSHCNKCGSTHHSVLYKHNTNWEEKDDHYYIYGTDAYLVLRCNGCDRIHFRHDSLFSEDKDDEGDPITRVEHYPPLISRKEPPWLTGIDSPFFLGQHVVARLLKEIYVALHSDLRALAAMGIRSLLEHIMIEKIGDDAGTIGNNVEAFISKGYVAPVSEPVFRTLIEAGHAAMHRKYAPSVDEIHTLLDITENIIASAYVHPNRTSSLKIPPRARDLKGKI